MNLLNPESGSLIAIPSQDDVPNEVRLSEDVISVSDADSTVFHLDKDQFSSIENPKISEFQSLHGLIPDRISSGTITFDKKEIDTVITPKPWVIGNLISAFMILLNQRNAFAVGTTFTPMLRTSIRLKSIPDYEAFLEYHFQRIIDTVISKLKECQFGIIPIFNSKLKKTKSGKEQYNGDHCGIAVLHKSPSSLRLYDSMDGAQGFEHIMPHILLQRTQLSPVTILLKGSVQYSGPIVDKDIPCNRKMATIV